MYTYTCIYTYTYTIIRYTYICIYICMYTLPCIWGLASSGSGPARLPLDSTSWSFAAWGERSPPSALE